MRHLCRTTGHNAIINDTSPICNFLTFAGGRKTDASLTGGLHHGQRISLMDMGFTVFFSTLMCIA